MIVRSIAYFVLAGLCEIGGGYLVWLWIRENKPLGYGVVGAAILVLYGIIPTLQPANFGRVYAQLTEAFLSPCQFCGAGKLTVFRPTDTI